MRRVGGAPVVIIGLVGAALLTVGIVYLTVACQSLPGFMGPHPGDTSPRAGLGIVAVVLAIAAFGVAYLTARRRHF
jgi:hypothetical protein